MSDQQPQQPAWTEAPYICAVQAPNTKAAPRLFVVAEVRDLTANFPGNLLDTLLLGSTIRLCRSDRMTWVPVGSE